MAKYKGSWLKGFASTFDPLGGLSWGLQWKEKKAAQKKIDDAVEQFKIGSMELATRFDKARSDGTITSQEYGDAMAWAIPLGKEMIGRVNDLYTNYQDMTPDQLKIELENIDAMFKFSKELDFTNLEQMKEFGSKLTQPDAKMQWNLVVKSIEGREKPEEPEVYKTIAEFQAKYGAETPYVFNATAGGYIPKFKEHKVKEPDLTGAINYLKKFPNPTPEQFNSLRTGAEKYFNVDLSNVTQESLREPKKIAEVKPEPTPAPTSTENIREDILNADKYSDAQRIYDNYATKYDVNALGITDLKQEWAKGQMDYLNKVKKSIDNLLVDRGDKGKWLNNKPVTKEMIGLDFDGEQPASEIYKILYKSYMEYLEKLRKLGIDVSQFPKIKPLSEIEKVGGWEGALGIGVKGIGIGIKKGDYKSIYY